MPNPPVHMNLARQVAERLGNDVLDANMGHYLLGSTSPDIRVIMRVDRSVYHFAQLDFEDIGTGMRGLFHSHPHLEKAADQSEQTQAFMAGYLTHLMADETWITNMFRPYFGNSDVFQDETLGLVMDRAMQLEMDRRCWDRVGQMRLLLDTPTEGIEVGFIPPESLADWAQWVGAHLDRGFSWERLRSMARRIAAGDEAHPAYEFAGEFADNASAGLERLYEIVPSERIYEYHETALDSLTMAVRDYLP